MQASDQISILEQGKATNGSDFYSYRYLATEGFLPGYNFPRLPLYAFIPGEGKTGSFLQSFPVVRQERHSPRSRHLQVCAPGRAGQGRPLGRPRSGLP